MLGQYSHAHALIKYNQAEVSRKSEIKSSHEGGVKSLSSHVILRVKS